MSKGAYEHHLLRGVDVSPNNETLPLIVNKDIADFGDNEPEGVLEKIFWGNQWADGFRDGTFSFHHYQSGAHEVVGVARGGAVLEFGGPGGMVIEVSAGDAVVIPAGVVHRRIDDAPGYSAVGAYPHRQVPDCCVLSAEDAATATVDPDAAGLAIKHIGENQLPEIKASILATVLPITDPVSGTGGAIGELWLGS